MLHYYLLTTSSSNFIIWRAKKCIGLGYPGHCASYATVLSVLLVVNSSYFHFSWLDYCGFCTWNWTISVIYRNTPSTLERACPLLFMAVLLFPFSSCSGCLCATLKRYSTKLLVYNGWPCFLRWLKCHLSLVCPCQKLLLYFGCVWIRCYRDIW